MRIRKLLLVHPSRSIRALIQKYILAELSDIEITESDSGEDALVQIGAKTYDVIIFSENLKDMALTTFKSHHEVSVSNGQTPLIIISDSESDEVRDALIGEGFSRVVQIRLRPSDLIKEINEVCDPRQWRKDARYHIPEVTVVVHSPNRKFEASLINISRGGILVELTTEDPSDLMNGGLSLALELPIAGRQMVIEYLTVKLLRVDAVAWNVRLVPKTMRATFIFSDLKPAPKNKLGELIQMAKEDKLCATEVVD